jgi:hypothetical protein
MFSEFEKHFPPMTTWHKPVSSWNPETEFFGLKGHIFGK